MQTLHRRDRPCPLKVCNLGMGYKLYQLFSYYVRRNSHIHFPRILPGVGFWPLTDLRVMVPFLMFQKQNQGYTSVLFFATVARILVSQCCETCGFWILSQSNQEPDFGICYGLCTLSSCWVVVLYFDKHTSQKKSIWRLSYIRIWNHINFSLCKTYCSIFLILCSDGTSFRFLEFFDEKLFDRSPSH